MFTIQRAESRFVVEHDWIYSARSFSFGDDYDPDNTSFGALRVLNDDRIAGGRGFGAHPHREMEIVTIVLSGQLEHEDSTGHKAVTGFGGIQRMSAGTGIIHSEMNPGESETELLQLWFTPDRQGLTPSYETSSYDPSLLKGSLLPIVSGRDELNGKPGVAGIHQDLTIYLSALEDGQSLVYCGSAGRRLFLFVLGGSLKVNEEHHLGRRDAARISDTEELRIAAGPAATFMLIDLP
ncbi:pirin family protein [Paenibacillus tarimensis]